MPDTPLPLSSTGFPSAFVYVIETKSIKFVSYCTEICPFALTSAFKVTGTAIVSPFVPVVFPIDTVALSAYAPVEKNRIVAKNAIHIIVNLLTTDFIFSSESI